MKKKQCKSNTHARQKEVKFCVLTLIPTICGWQANASRIPYLLKPTFYRSNDQTQMNYLSFHVFFFTHLSWPTHQFVLNCTFHPVKPVFPFSDNWPASKPYTLHQLHHSLVTVLQTKPPRKVCDPIRENKHRTVIARLRCSFEQEREIEDAIKCFCNWQPNGTHQGASWMFFTPSPLTGSRSPYMYWNRTVFFMFCSGHQSLFSLCCSWKWLLSNRKRATHSAQAQQPERRHSNASDTIKILIDVQFRYSLGDAHLNVFFFLSPVFVCESGLLGPHPTLHHLRAFVRCSTGERIASR